jgi:predicted DNA-binding transcriptional regulator AlpA
MFHKVKFGIRKAFVILFEMSATTKSISCSQIAKRLKISRPTAWLFMHKVRIAMKSSETFPIKGKVIVDEFVFGGQEDLKQGRS